MSEEKNPLLSYKMRTAYAESIDYFINNIAKECQKKRDKILYAPQDEKRKRLKAMLGVPLSLNEKWQARVIETESFSTSDCVATKYYFDVNGLRIGGILYESLEGSSNQDAFVLALHGGGGSPEIVGDYTMSSENYNHMVKRILRRGIT